MRHQANQEATRVIEAVCPHCAARWALPREQIGPGGARVRCARCEGAFEWRRARPGRESVATVPSASGPIAERAALIVSTESPVAEHAVSIVSASGPIAERALGAASHGSAEREAAGGAESEDALSGWDLDTWLEDAAASSPASSAVDELDPSDVTPDLVARLAVEELVSTRAEELLEAYDCGELFARFGPALVGAWSRCRARLGATGDPEAFRTALRARLGIDLPAWQDRR